MLTNRGKTNRAMTNRVSFEHAVKAFEKRTRDIDLSEIPEDVFQNQFKAFVLEAEKRGLKIDFDVRQRPKATNAQIVTTAVAVANFVLNHWEKFCVFARYVEEFIDAFPS